MVPHLRFLVKEYYKKMKHSRETRGFSRDSLVCCETPSFPFSSEPLYSTVLTGDVPPPFSTVLAGDLPPRLDVDAVGLLYLTFSLGPPSTRVAGDLDRRPEPSPGSRRTPLGDPITRRWFVPGRPGTDLDVT